MASLQHDDKEDPMHWPPPPSKATINGTYYLAFILGFILVCIGIMEKKMETTIQGLGLRV